MTIVAVCRLAILKRMPATPLTQLMAHRLYNSDKLSSLRVDELSLYFSHHKITFKGKKAEKVAMIKAHIGSLLHNSTSAAPAKKCEATSDLITFRGRN